MMNKSRYPTLVLEYFVCIESHVFGCYINADQ